MLAARLWRACYGLVMHVRPTRPSQNYVPPSAPTRRRASQPRPVASALIVVISLALLLGATPRSASACPEVIVPMDFRDTAFKSRAWKKPMALYAKHRHAKALRAFRKVSATLEKKVVFLFQPKDDASAASNTKIQTWLKRHVYTPNPGVLIHRDRFTYPVQVWRAWADSACRSGAYDEALLALRRIESLAPTTDLTQQRTMVLLRLGRYKPARTALKAAPPDRFFTPFAEALISIHDGDLANARAKFAQAGAAADLPSRKAALKKAVAALPALPSP